MYLKVAGNVTITITGETEPSEPVVDKGILGDVDGNGKVNIKDATAIQKFVAKIETGLPIGEKIV